MIMAKRMNHHVTVVVRAIHDEPGGVRRLTLADPDNWPLPGFTPGAHIDVHLPKGRVRQYSLTNNPRDNTRYDIAVALEKDGRGGSKSIHADIRVGDLLAVSLPRNLFPVAESGEHILIAGGIGVTPFLSMLPHFEQQHQNYELHYCTRHADQTPFSTELAARVTTNKVRHYFTRDPANSKPNLKSIVGNWAPDRHVYCCGPNRMVDAVLELTSSWPADHIHIERFGAAGTQDAAYTVTLGRSGRQIPVPSGQSMLSALRNAGVDMPSSCEAGVCLECKTRYTSGDVLHRDLVMPAADRKQFLTPCVSGCQGSSIVLDL